MTEMAFNARLHRPSVSERRGQRLAPLETNFNRSPAHSNRPVPNRPRPDYASMDGEVTNRIPLQPAKRQSSRTSLRSLFGGRDKSSRKPVRDAKLGEIDELPRPESRFNPNESRITVAPSEALLSPDSCQTPKTAQTTPTLVTSPTFPTTPQLAQKHNTPSKASTTTPVKPGDEEKGKTTPGGKDMGWKPPPLFQAYPQSLKHGSLPAPTISSDAILRVHAAANGNGDGSMGNSSQQSDQTPETNHMNKKKREEKEKKHTRSVSQIINKSDWTQKIYVVSTAGYILQYAGDGKYDRLPEKMLLLGPKSVAFASDAIPGKHWVLQVSQDPEADATEENTSSTNSSSTSRPLLARLGFQRSYTRRITHSLLLVFNDPNEMSSWLLTVRAEIEARGGKKYVSERVFDDGMEHQLEPKTSVRHLVKRDPNRFSNLYLQPQAEDGDGSALSRQSSFVSNNRHSIISSTTQTDVTVPPVGGHDSSSGRFYATTTAPREPPVSPAVHNGFLASAGGGSVPPSPMSDIAQTPTPTPKNRQSPMPLQSQPQPQPQPTEYSAEPPRSQSPFLRSASPPAPNFSVPSFSKRFAAKSSLSQIPPMQLQWDDDNDHASQHGSVDTNSNSISNRYNNSSDHYYESSNTFASFPSPPQSPQRSFSSMSRPDLNDLYGGGYVSQQGSLTQTQRPLRVSESHDSLAMVDQDRKPSSSLTRPPKGSVSTVNSTARPSRPISIISGSDTSEPHEPVPPPPPPHQHQYQYQYQNQYTTKSSRREPRGRTSTLYQNNHNTPSATATATTTTATPAVSRRKSMPGLAAGPPSLPPPTCPLPKIPSPVQDTQYQYPSSSVADLPARALSPPVCASPPPKLRPAARQVLSERSESPGLSSGGLSRSGKGARYSSLGPRTVSSLSRHA